MLAGFGKVLWCFEMSFMELFVDRNFLVSTQWYVNMPCFHIDMLNLWQ